MTPGAASLINETESLLRQEFRSLAVARTQFPMLTDWGIEDFSETVHSLGMNYLASIGKAVGRIAVSEYPVKVSGGTDGPRHVRPDAVWWDATSQRIELVGEFERYEGQELKDKVRNLLLAHRALGEGPRLLLLMLWTLSGTQVQPTGEFQSMIRSGFRTPGGIRVAGLEADSRLLVATAILAESGGHLRLKEILL